MFIAKKWLILLFIVYSILIGALPFMFSLGFGSAGHELGYMESLLDDCLVEHERHEK